MSITPVTHCPPHAVPIKPSRRSFRATLTGALLLTGLLASTPGLAGDDPHGLRHATAESCSGCHQEIYKQWKGSMHANSSAFKDPIHGAMYRKVIGDPGQEGVTKKGKPPVCLKCHAPAAARDGKTKLDALPAYNDGVTCVTCHTISAFKGSHKPDGKLRLGVDAYEFADTLQGPSGRNLGPAAVMQPKPLTKAAIPPDLREKQNATSSTPGGQGDQGGFHPIPLQGNPTMLKTTAACLGCHEQRNNGKGVPLCMTGSEFRSAGGGNFNCQACHMPVNNGFADHSMAGGHVQAMVERAVLMEMTATALGDTVKASVTLTNMLPHKVPTGAPFRNMYVKVEGLDSSGAVIWTNYQTHPIKEDPKSIMMLVLLDKDGKPSGPPTATKQGKDSRLAPNEVRSLEYDMSGKGIATVRAELHYDLLLPPLKEALTKVPAELKKSKVVAFAEVEL